jgi:hypothetical protein
MPCNDITELIQVVVDAEDRLKSYRFVKRTCGQGVGVDTLLMDVLGGQQVDQILAISPEEFLEEHPAEEAIEEFLGLKHLIAVQSALEVLVGAEPGGADALCAAAEIAWDEGDTILDAVIRIDLVTEAIKSCGNCRGCGSKRPAKRVKSLFN